MGRRGMGFAQICIRSLDEVFTRHSMIEIASI